MMVSVISSMISGSANSVSSAAKSSPKGSSNSQSDSAFFLSSVGVAVAAVKVFAAWSAPKLAS